MNAFQYMTRSLPHDVHIDLTKPEPDEYTVCYLGLSTYQIVKKGIHEETTHPTWRKHYLRDAIFLAMDFSYPGVEVDAVLDLDLDNFYGICLMLDQLLGTSDEGRMYLVREEFYEQLAIYKHTDLGGCDAASD